MTDVNQGFASAFGSAFDEATKEVEPEAKTQDPEPVVEDKVTKEVAPETREEKVAESAADKLADEDLNLSAEEMAAIEADPKLRKVYKNMQRGLTLKTTSIADERKKLSEREAILKQIEDDPEQAALALAKAAGLEVVKPGAGGTTEQAISNASKKMAELFGPEAAAALEPVFKGLVKEILDQEVGPYKQTTEQLQHAAFKSHMSAAVEQFKASLPEDLDPQVEKEMVALMPRLQPGKDVSPQQYLKLLYDNVTAGKSRAKVVSEAAERIRKAKDSQEPVVGVRSPREPETSINKEKSFSDNFSAAFDEAVREVKRS